MNWQGDNAVKQPAQLDVELDLAMREFLDQIISKYKLPDAGKAVRCLVNFAREKPDLHDAIFKQIRCLDC